MNKIKQILIGAGMIALSGNAAAMIISDGSGNMKFSDYDMDFIQAVINGEYQLAERYRAKLGKKVGRLEVKMAKLETRGIGAGNKRRLNNKISRKEGKIAKFMNRVGLDQIALSLPIENGPTSPGENVPEPSTIALLGLGLVGIGAARRLRKKAR